MHIRIAVGSILCQQVREFPYPIRYPVSARSIIGDDARDRQVSAP